MPLCQNLSSLIASDYDVIETDNALYILIGYPRNVIKMNEKKLDSMLVNVPVTSPLHPQLNLCLLKAHLEEEGYKSKVFDTSIMFYHWFLGDAAKKYKIDIEECFQNPIQMLGYYNNIQKDLWDRSKSYDGLSVGLRSLGMKYNRTDFDQVIKALKDQKANPFIDFYNKFINDNVLNSGIKVLGIAITFQDQIIPAFTLASLIREKMPHVKIAMGGQMITRCQNTMTGHRELCSYFDYLCLWDGEIPLKDVHDRVIKGDQKPLVNIIDVSLPPSEWKVVRTETSLKSKGVPFTNFDDIDFNLYFYPEMLIPLQTTRGCYAKCAFCAIPFGSNSYRVRTPEDVVADIEKIQEHTLKKYGKKATYFKFMEDTSSPVTLQKISEEIIRKKLDVKWETFARLEKAFSQPGMMKTLFDGGCRKIHWGLESNDPNILKKMNKKTEQSYSDQVLKLAADAGILNFCFVLVGFPTETEEMREAMGDYICDTKAVHTLTLTTFDLTRGSPMEQEFTKENPYGLDMVPAEGFQVRLPYTVHGQNWKEFIIPKAHEMMIKIIKNRPDIGFMTLFPDQVRAVFCEQFGNDWGMKFVAKYGEDNVREMLENTQRYSQAYASGAQVDIEKLPEPLQREHLRTKEDLAMIANAVNLRKDYEKLRHDQV